MFKHVVTLTRKENLYENGNIYFYLYSMANFFFKTYTKNTSIES